MKLLLVSIVYINFFGSNALNENILSEVEIPLGFDITNVDAFKGFDAFHFDGQTLNPFQTELDDIVQRFVKKYNRHYNDGERHQRRENIRKSILSIAKIIVSFETKRIVPTFKVGLNGLSDKSDEEYRQLYGNGEKLKRTFEVSDRQKRSTIREAICKPKTNVTLPASFDWRQHNIVTQVKSQSTNCKKVITRQYESGDQIITEYSYQCDSCGCCWAFAATATIESQWAKKTGQLIEFSEQDLLNCASTHGCNGESLDAAYSYVMTNGQAKEATVPYTAKVGQCNHYPIVSGVQISDFCRKGGITTWTRTYSNGTVEKWNETEDNPDSKIMRDLYETGPLVVMVNADDMSAKHYVSGIYDVPNCSHKTNHAITLIGWGTENNVDFWIVKNSWDKTWGESGYIRIVRGKNMCGINDIYYYPILTNATPFSKTS